MRNLFRLVYTSIRSVECDDQELKNILESCKRNNPGRGVTGLLLHSESRFIQYMEGRKEDVEALYDLIQDDPRHTAINKRSFQAIENREFPSWEMGYKNVNGLKLNTHVTQNDYAKFRDLVEGDLDFSNDGMRLLQLFAKV